MLILNHQSDEEETMPPHVSHFIKYLSTIDIKNEWIWKYFDEVCKNRQKQTRKIQ
jgi:hypothetical protein